MRSVEGIYDGQKLELLENIEVQTPCKVIVTFIEEDAEVESLRKYPSDDEAFDFWNTNAEDLYQDYLQKQK